MRSLTLTLLVALLVSPAVFAADKEQEESEAPLGPQPLMGPWLQYDGPDSALVRWVTAAPLPSKAVWRFGDKRMEASAAGLATQHELRLEKLPIRSVGVYQVFLPGAGKAVLSREYEFDTMFNYSLSRMAAAWPYETAAEAQRFADLAAGLLSQSPAPGGYCVVIGCEPPALLYELAKQSPYYIVAVDTDAAAVQRCREALRATGGYGHRITSHHLRDWADLPFTRFFANLVISSKLLFNGELSGKAATWYRLVQPQHGVLLLGQPEAAATALDPAALEAWLRQDAVPAAPVTALPGNWWGATRPGLEGAGQWTHQYGSPDNSARSGEKLLGATRTQDLAVQWLGRPGPRAMVDRNPRKPSPLYANGRLFTQGMNRIIAQDVYNGAILWSLEIPDLHRYNMPRDCSNWCADQDALYLAIREKCWRIDAASGALTQTFDVLPAQADQPWDWGYLARVDNRLFGSSIVKDAAYTNFRGQALQGWYDAKIGKVTYKVCSDAIFALDAATGALQWRYDQALIINPTITIAEGKVFFMQSRSESAREVADRQISSRRLAESWQLVALDAQSGAVLWERPIENTEEGKVVLYLLHANQRLIMATSDKDYRLYAFNPENGDRLWETRHDWTADNHSGHMQHPTIVGGAVYYEPRGYHLADGALATEKMGRHEGCATYAATENGLLYRGAGRRIAMWDAATEKVSTWDRLRPGCWLSTIAGGGMILSPEGGGGCSCGGWMETSLTFLKKEE